MSTSHRVVLRTALIDDPAAMAGFTNPATPTDAGAVVTFSGVVRNHDGGRDVRELEYEAHPSAAAELERAAQDVSARHPSVQAIRVAHRVGLLQIGEAALFAEVCSAHRGEAFAACADLVETVKATIPVWKRQVFTDGTDEWVNSA